MDIFAQLNPRPAPKTVHMTARVMPVYAGMAMVKRVLATHGWVEDRYGNFYKKAKPGRRYNLKSRAVRYEAQLADGKWFRLRSGFYRHLYVNQNGSLCGMKA